MNRFIWLLLLLPVQLWADVWQPSSSYTGGQSIVDSNGNVEVAVGSQTATITNIQVDDQLVTGPPVSHKRIVTLFFSSATPLSVVSNVFLSLAGLTTVPSLNGGGATITTIMSPLQVQLTYSFAGTLPPVTPYSAETGTATTGNGITGTTQPTWAATSGAVTIDGGAQWVNHGLFQPDRAIPGWCQSGATKAQVSGMSSSNTMQGTIPDCTVTVFLTGTTTRATIHSDPFNTPLSNPFTAADSGQWTFWAQPATAYDIVLSGGRPGNTYHQPVTLTAIQVGGPGAGGATSPGGNNQEVQFNAGGFFQGTTGLTWDAANSVLKYPTGAMSANTINAATALTAGAITSGPITSSNAINGVNLTASSAVNGATVTASGAVSGATLNSTGNATVGGNLAVTGSMGTVNATTVTATGSVNGASVSAAGGSYQVAIPWDTGQPNIANGLVGCTGSGGAVHTCPLNAPSWSGIQVSGGPGSGGPNSVLAVSGQVACTFDGPATVGDYVQLSTLTSGNCHDAGASAPGNGLPVMGQVVALGTAPQATLLLNSAGGGGMTGPAGPSGPAGPPGGSLSYPGVVSDSNNGLNVTGGVSASSLPGYRQNALTARSRNRDEVLQLTVTPQDMPGCQNSGRGLLDDAPCFNAAINYLAGAGDNTLKRLIVPETPQGYNFVNPGYLQPLPWDYGDYHGGAGWNTPGAVTLQFVNGALAYCAATGGSGYAPSANLPVYILDHSLKGSGAMAWVQTDATGTPNGCTVKQAGMGYPPSNVQGYIVPVGGDGATATATLAGGTITGVTVNTGGSGYSTAGAAIPVYTALTNCSPAASFTAVVTNAAISAANVTAAGANCKYLGLSSGSVPLYFGATCGGVQCALMTPEVPVNQPCAVALINNLTIEGAGMPTIKSTWAATGNSAATVFTSGMFMFCEPSGINFSNITIRNLNIDATLIAFYFPLEADNFRMDNVNFGAQVAIPFYANSISGQPYYGSAPYNGLNGVTKPLSEFKRIGSLAEANMVCGGAWAGRNVVNPGGYQSLLWSYALLGAAFTNTQGIYAHGAPNMTHFGRCGNYRIEGWVSDVGHGGQYNIGPGQNGSFLDKWFEQYIWKSQNGADQSAMPAGVGNPPAVLYSNGQTNCAITQTVVNRSVDATDPNYGYPYYWCYAGVASGGFIFTPRHSGNANVETSGSAWPGAYMGDIFMSQPFRPMFTGRFDNVEIKRINATYAGNGGPFPDPYQVGTNKPAIMMGNYYTALRTAKIDDVIFFVSYPFNTAVSFYNFGYLSNSASVFARNVYAYSNGTPGITTAANDNLSASTMTIKGYSGSYGNAPVPGNGGTLSIIEMQTAAGAGGGLAFGAGSALGSTYPVYSFAGIRGSLIGGTTTTTYPYGDLVFYTRTNNTLQSMAESWRMKSNGALVLSYPFYPMSYTTGTIPACNGGSKGAEGVVTDATAPTYLGTYTGGGAVTSPVMCNGTNWVTY